MRLFLIIAALTLLTTNLQIGNSQSSVDPLVLTLLKTTADSDFEHKSKFFQTLNQLARRAGYATDNLTNYDSGEDPRGGRARAILTKGRAVSLVSGELRYVIVILGTNFFSVPGVEAQKILLLDETGKIRDQLSCGMNSRYGSLITEFPSKPQDDNAQIVIRFVSIGGTSGWHNWHTIDYEGKSRTFYVPGNRDPVELINLGLVRLGVRDRKFSVIFPDLTDRQNAQRGLPVTPSPNNDQRKAPMESQSDALKRLNQLADDASLIGDASARSRLLARIASLLWPYDETRARMLFKFAFDRAVDIPKPEDDAKEKRLTCGLVRAEVTRSFAEHDAKSAAEALLNSAGETTCYFGPRNRASSEHPRSEMLSLTAVSVVTSDPDLAYRLGLMSLEDGITAHVRELLNKLSVKDDRLARQLLSACIDRISGKDVNALEILDVAYFLFQDEISADPKQRAEANVEEKAEFKKAFATKLLNAALVATDRFIGKIEQQQRGKEKTDEHVTDPEILQVWTHEADIRELAASYYSMLLDVQEGVKGYDRDKFQQTQSLLYRLGRWMDPVDRDHMLVFYDNGDTPESLVGEAEKTSDPGQKRELYELASQLAQQKGDQDKALELAAKIDDEERRNYLSDGLKLQRAFQAANKQEFGEARALIETITRPETRLRAFIDIAERITPTGETRKKEASALLDEAQVLLGTGSPGPQQARTMMELARVYAQADSETAFNVTARAIDLVNSSSGSSTPDKTRWQFARIMTFSDPLSIFGTETRLFETLAKIDYVRALRLGKSFNDPALVVSAQLSVVRMNLPPVRK